MGVFYAVTIAIESRRLFPGVIIFVFVFVFDWG
jgi:hypothetical protein